MLNVRLHSPSDKSQAANAPVLDQPFRPPTPAELAALVEDVVLTQDLLFDRTKIAAAISIEVERRLVSEAVIRGDRL